MFKRVMSVCVAGFLVYVVIAIAACGGTETTGNGQQAWPEPAPGCPYYTQEFDLPQTESAEQLSEYLASEHLDYDLDGWFFFGSLVDSAAPDDPGVFFISMQRIDVEEQGETVPLVPIVVAFNSASLGQYVFGGEYTVDTEPIVNIVSDPWTVEVLSPPQEEPFILMSLTSGSMGAAGAQYRLTADVPDQLGGRLQAEVLVRDRLGAVNQGYGTSSFFPQFLTDRQQEQIIDSYGYSVGSYLEATGDPMSCQGSYYYSQPLMDVEQFTITRNGAPLSSGTEGTIWMDNVVQTYDQQASEVLADASWEFYSIMLPELDSALMVIQISSANGVLPVASLFSEVGDRTRNSALKAVNSWDTSQIDVQAVPGTFWVSPETGLQYAQEHHIQLDSDAWLADLTIKMVRENQEVVVGNTVKYEGLAVVEGTLGGQPVTGTAFVELQPVGRL